MKIYEWIVSHQNGLFRVRCETNVKEGCMREAFQRELAWHQNKKGGGVCEFKRDRHAKAG
jgi:hypothetical protein